jgi:hypothetical protein
MTTYYDNRCVSKPWFACYQEHGQRMPLGSFKTKAEAEQAYLNHVNQRKLHLVTDGPMPESVALSQPAPRKTLAFGVLPR